MVEVGCGDPALALWWMFQFWRSTVRSLLTTPVGRLVFGSSAATRRASPISYPSVKDLRQRQRLAEAVLAREPWLTLLSPFDPNLHVVPHDAAFAARGVITRRLVNNFGP